MYHAALRVRVREVQQALRIDHDRLGAGEERGEMPEVQSLEGPTAARWFHGADVKEELSVREGGCVECGVSVPDGRNFVAHRHDERTDGRKPDASAARFLGEFHESRLTSGRSSEFPAPCSTQQIQPAI